MQETHLDEQAVGQDVAATPVPLHGRGATQDELGMEEIYRKLRPSLLARCYQILLSPHAAQDATQDVFLRTMRQGTRFHSEDDARKYMMRVAHNVSLNILRSNLRLTSMPDVVVDAGALDAETACVARQFVKALRVRCGDPDVDLADRCLLDLEPQSAVADELGCNRRTIYNRLRRVKAVAREIADAIKSPVM
ncbi:MAG: sigma-70 family RNA polymerase sigma factor [Deltaproteobacteria bacterium]|nr:sigma-70 family RNA polymerase sigma factor [Deltaproteobacteria bacterium]